MKYQQRSTEHKGLEITADSKGNIWIASQKLHIETLLDNPSIVEDAEVQQIIEKIKGVNPTDQSNHWDVDEYCEGLHIIARHFIDNDERICKECNAIKPVDQFTVQGHAGLVCGDCKGKCPNCGSTNLNRESTRSLKRPNRYVYNVCEECDEYIIVTQGGSGRKGRRYSYRNNWNRNKKGGRGNRK